MGFRTKIAAAITIAYIALASLNPAKAAGRLDILSHYNFETGKAEPYGELWLLKSFPKGLSGELYAETMAQNGDITGIYAELLGYYNIGQYFRMPGLALWAENVMITGAKDFYRGGIMWFGSPWKNAFFLARAGYGSNMERDDLTARIIFNQNLGKGSIGFLVNSQSIASGHLYSEIPRLELKLTDAISLTGEGMFSRNDINGKVEEDFGARAGIRINF